MAEHRLQLGLFGCRLAGLLVLCGVQALAQVQRTPDELLSAKNFGVTSLNEVKDQLRKLGLNLASEG